MRRRDIASKLGFLKTFFLQPAGSAYLFTRRIQSMEPIIDDNQYQSIPIDIN